MSVPTVTLTYFQAPGRAFAIRVCLGAAQSAGKLKFIDERLPFAEIQARKANPPEGYCPPLGQVPILRFDTGETFCQSIAIGRWASEQGGLLPKDELLALRVDEVSASLNECWSAAPFGGDDLKQRREAWMKATESRFLPYFEKRLAEMGGPFFLGKDLSIADLWVYTLCNMVETGFYDHVPKDWLTGGAYPGLKTLTDAVREHPLVVQYGK